MDFKKFKIDSKRNLIKFFSVVRFTHLVCNSSILKFLFNKIVSSSIKSLYL